MYMMSSELNVVGDEIDKFELKHIGSILNLNIEFDGILNNTQAQVTKVELLGVPVEATLDLSTGVTVENCLSEVSDDVVLTAAISNA